MDVTIPDLPPGATPMSTSPFESVEAGTSVRYTLAQITAAITGGGGTGPFLPITGGTLTGPLGVGAAPSLAQNILEVRWDWNDFARIIVKNADPGVNAAAQVLLSNNTTFGGLQINGTGTAQPGLLTLFNQSAAIDFHVNGAERARITADGFLKASNTGSYSTIGTPSHEMANADASFITQLFNTNSSPIGMLINYSNAAPNTASAGFLYGSDNAATRFYFASNGGLANFSANNVNLSDATLKEDINPYSQQELDSLEQSFKAVQWCRYKYKDQTHSDWNHGYLAQDIATAFANVAPELVEEIDIGKEGGAALKAAVYATDLANISHALLARALARIADLEARLTAAGV